MEVKENISHNNFQVRDTQPPKTLIGSIENSLNAHRRLFPINQDERIRQFMLSSPSIINYIISQILIKAIDMRERNNKLKDQLPALLREPINNVEACLAIKEDFTVNFIDLIDNEPVSFVSHIPIPVLKQGELMKDKFKQFYRKKQKQKTAKFGTIDTTRKQNQKTFRRNGLSRMSLQPQFEMINRKTPCLSLISVQTHQQPQSPITAKIRLESCHQLVDRYRQRKQLVQQNQRRNLRNLKNIQFTFGYECQRINVQKNQKGKLPEIVVVMTAQHNNKREHFQRKCNSIYQKYEMRSQNNRSICAGNLMKTGSHWEELNESNVLKSMLDKIMNTTTGKQKKKVSAHKTGAYSRKKLY